MLPQGIGVKMAEQTNIFIGPPERVHDARMSRTSPFYSIYPEGTGNNMLVGDIRCPLSGNGAMAAADLQHNGSVSCGRVTAEICSWLFEEHLEVHTRAAEDQNWHVGQTHYCSLHAKYNNGAIIVLDFLISLFQGAPFSNFFFSAYRLQTTSQGNSYRKETFF